MNPAQLVAECHRIRAAFVAQGMDPDAADVRLVLPGESRGERRRLAGRGGPLGTVGCVNETPERGVFSVVFFRAIEVLAWLKRQGVCTDCIAPGIESE